MHARTWQVACRVPRGDHAILAHTMHTAAPPAAAAHASEAAGAVRHGGGEGHLDAGVGPRDVGFGGGVDGEEVVGALVGGEGVVGPHVVLRVEELRGVGHEGVGRVERVVAVADVDGGAGEADRDDGILRNSHRQHAVPANPRVLATACAESHC